MATILGRIATVRIACALLLWGGILLNRPQPVAAQWVTSAPITEEEAFVYVSTLFSAGHQCDSEWFAGQFLPSARVVFIYADGQEESFNPSQYGERIKQYCRPYDIINIKWDRHHLQVSSMGSVTSVRWSNTWGERLHMTTGNGESKIRFENWMDLVKESQRIRIAGAGWQAYELVPGAAKEFEAIAQGDLLFYRLSQFFGRIFGRRQPEQRVTRHEGDGWANP